VGGRRGAGHEIGYSGLIRIGASGRRPGVSGVSYKMRNRKPEPDNYSNKNINTKAGCARISNEAEQVACLFSSF